MARAVSKVSSSSSSATLLKSAVGGAKGPQAEGQSFSDTLGRVQGADPSGGAAPQPNQPATPVQPAKAVAPDKRAAVKVASPEPQADVENSAEQANLTDVEKLPHLPVDLPDEQDSTPQEPAKPQKSEKKQAPPEQQIQEWQPNIPVDVVQMQAKPVENDPTTASAPARRVSRTATPQVSGPVSGVESKAAPKPQPAVQKTQREISPDSVDVPSDSQINAASAVDDGDSPVNVNPNETAPEPTPQTATDEAPDAPVAARAKDSRHLHKTDQRQIAAANAASATDTARITSGAPDANTSPPLDFDSAEELQSIEPVSASDHLIAKKIDDLSFDVMPQGNSTPPAHIQQSQSTSSSSAAPPNSPDIQFAQMNHAKIVSEIQGRLLPNGGSMHLRLDPPELGAIHVHVEMRDGVMAASFETSGDQASKLLSHSLADLKTTLEAQGISVGKLHVSQAPRQQTSSSSSEGNKQDDAGSGQSPARQEQQRREMLKRMWQKLTGMQDPVDLVA
jgi:flagellar hook-length control protein FliK